MSIHSTAIIDPSAKIGQDVTIGPYAVIGPDVILGDRCVIGAHAILEYAELGAECQVFPQALIGLAPQHMRYKNEKTKVVIGARCVFREGVTVHRGTMFGAGVTRIGDDGYFMAFSHIAHDGNIGNKVVLANGVLLAGHVELGDNVFISGLAAVHQFGRVGRGALISGGTMAVLDVAPFCIAQGDRAVLRGLNVVGLRRSGVDRPSIKLLKEAYRTAFLSKLTLEEALKQSALLVDNVHVAVFREFLSAPKRGFTRPASASERLEEEEVMA